MRGVRSIYVILVKEGVHAVKQQKGFLLDVTMEGLVLFLDIEDAKISS